MTDTLPMPVDVRLMNVTTALLVTGLVLACVVAGLWWVLRNPAFAIRQIVVAGDTVHNSAASLRAAVVPRLAGNFFTLDLAAAHWGEDDTHLVNSHGEVFEAAGGNDLDERRLPVLSGPEGQSAQVLAMYRLLDPLVAPLGTEIAELALLARGNWQAELANGAAIELGHGESAELAARLTQFVATVKEVAARHQRGVDAVEAADLRHAGGYALRLRGVSTVRPEPRPAPQR